MPSFTVQCGKYFLLASSCLAASCSAVSFFLSGSSTSPCQFVRSLPLKRAEKPGGGILSLGPAFSSSLAAATRPMATTIPNNTFDFCMLILLVSRRTRKVGGKRLWEILANSSSQDRHKERTSSSHQCCVLALPSRRVYSTGNDDKKDEHDQHEHECIENQSAVDFPHCPRAYFLVQRTHANEQPDRIDVQEGRQREHAAE